MAKNVRIPEALYALAQREATLEDCSIAQQMEHWAKSDLAAASQRTHIAVTSSQGAAAMTRELDTLDVLSGERSADYLHFIPRTVARQSRAVFPSRYRKS
ncbi:MAG: ParD-like family protein [Dokdonella sp.]|nr:ParD-like family protein [Dokdonella sp.]